MHKNNNSMDKNNPNVDRLPSLATTNEQLCKDWWLKNGEQLSVHGDLTKQGINCIYRVKTELCKSNPLYSLDYFIERKNGATCYCMFDSEESMYAFLKS